MSPSSSNLFQRLLRGVREHPRTSLAAWTVASVIVLSAGASHEQVRSAVTKIQEREPASHAFVSTEVLEGECMWDGAATPTLDEAARLRVDLGKKEIWALSEAGAPVFMPKEAWLSKRETEGNPLPMEFTGSLDGDGIDEASLGDYRLCFTRSPGREYSLEEQQRTIRSVFGFPTNPTRTPYPPMRP